MMTTTTNSARKATALSTPKWTKSDRGGRGGRGAGSGAPGGGFGSVCRW
jgi:hypothetical protein